MMDVASRVSSRILPPYRGHCPCHHLRLFQDPVILWSTQPQSRTFSHQIVSSMVPPMNAEIQAQPEQRHVTGVGSLLLYPTPPRRATQSSNASRPRPKPPSKLTILLLPFHVSCNAGSGILSYYSYADERIADSTQVGHTCKLLTKVLDRVGCCI